MSASRSAQCLTRRAILPSSLPVSTRRGLHCTTRRSAAESEKTPTAQTRQTKNHVVYTSQGVTRSPGDATAPKDEIPLTRESAEKYFPRYTKEEMAFLQRKYTPQQMAAVEAGEAAVDPLDLLKQGAVRSDSMRVKYLDDFRNRHPTMDRKLLAPQTNLDPDIRLKSDQEIDEDVASFWLKMTEKQAQGEMTNDDFELEFEKFMDKFRYTVGKEEAERDPPNYMQAPLKKLVDPLVKRTVTEDEAPSGAAGREYLDQLSIETGLSVNYLTNTLKSKKLVHNAVSNQTRMGKIHSTLVITVVGNGNGLLGIGQGKGREVPAAERQAFTNAVRNLAPVPRYERRTIFGDTSAKVGATVVHLYNRPPGFGVRCQEKIWEMAKCAGISDLAARVPNSRNPMNTVKAAYEALMKQRLPDDVARGRGRKMVDVRKVYYAGMN